MNDIEQERLNCEKLDTIALNITRRFERNPAVFYRNQAEYYKTGFPTTLASSFDNSELARKNSLLKVEKPLRSKKQILAQQHEINRFCKIFKDTKLHMQEGKGFTRDLVQVAKGELGNQDELDFLRFDSIVNNIIDEHESRTGNSEKTHFIKSTKADSLDDEFSMFPHQLQILSKAAQDININSFFQREEKYGEFLNLIKYHTLWLSVIKSADLSYLEFLRITIGNFKKQDYAYILSNKKWRDTPQYHYFLLQLNNYLVHFIQKTFPLFPYEKFEEHRIVARFDNFLQTGLNIDSQEHKSENNIYCLVCDEFLHTEASPNNASQKSHGQTKKHIQNLKKRENVCFQELKLHMLCSGLLSEIIDNTESFTEMKLSYTNKERLLELDKLSQLYEEDLYTQKEFELDQQLKSGNPRSRAEKDVSTNRKSTEYGHVDPKGSVSKEDQSTAEIPKWLRKLKKLDVEYQCEICGNVTYKGYKLFQKHFFESKHVLGLKCLGYSGNPSQFKGIVKVSDMKALQYKLLQTASLVDRTDATQGANTSKDATKSELESNQWFVEVEDSQGNVVKKKK
ncbi:Pre-mRNA-splicing factor PRP9 [Hanseniaspora osmophila]|uniref:Pre-mRNA-splicing factor PRP9 n=1 Tax=Hanseniaspora osmophila TaxID=56408 RepID=A0A1E5R097_9ASCO|nr:Pre-mRNA-splicing factor PRP9 [Hanseniaspora osmophila]